MYRLYWNSNSGAFAVEAALILCRAPFEGQRVDHKAGEHREAAYLAINPAGQLPALALPDGTIVTESAATLLHLADAFPDSGHWPRDSSKRAVAFRWLVFASAQLYETDVRYTYPDRYASDPACADAVRQAAHERIDVLWAILADAREPGPFLFGQDMTLLDPYLAMIAGWHYDPPRLWAAQPRVRRLAEAASSRPEIGPLWEKYGLTKPEAGA